jgi:hypothetical protein
MSLRFGVANEIVERGSLMAIGEKNRTWVCLTAVSERATSRSADHCGVRVRKR